jgi:hypothetical protein
LPYILQVGALKIYAATVEVLKKNERQGETQALKKKERQGETQFTTKTDVPPPLNSNVFLFFGNLTLFMTKLRVLLLFSLFYR